MPYKLSAASIANRAGVDRRLIEISDMAITISHVDFGHGQFSGKRTAIEQNHLYTIGASKADGYIIIGKHQLGGALDAQAYINEVPSWEQNHLAMVATAFLQSASILGYKLEWGGLWRAPAGSIYGWDMPHFQLQD